MQILPPARSRGRFQKGQSGNPGGRPAMPPEVRDALEAGSALAAQRLVELIGNEDPRVAAMASIAVLDRLYGRPAQSVDATVRQEDIGVVHLRVLQEIAARREARLKSEGSCEEINS